MRIWTVKPQLENLMVNLVTRPNICIKQWVITNYSYLLFYLLFNN